jgi:hypothetical protein
MGWFMEVVVWVMKEKVNPELLLSEKGENEESFLKRKKKKV